jgi:hypothetical protein
MARRSRPNQAPDANQPTGAAELEVDFFLTGSLLWFHGKIAASQKYRMAWPVNRSWHGHTTANRTDWEYFNF